MKLVITVVVYDDERINCEVRYDERKKRKALVVKEARKVFRKLLRNMEEAKLV